MEALALQFGRVSLPLLAGQMHVNLLGNVPGTGQVGDILRASAQMNWAGRTPPGLTPRRAPAS